MTEENKRNKRPVAHKIAMKLLEINPENHYYTLCKMYGSGLEVPLKDIPKLIAAFKKAGNELRVNSETISKVIQVLHKQLVKKEEKEKEKERERRKKS